MRILIPIIATIMLALPALGSECLLFPDKRLDNPDICETKLENVAAKDKAFHFVPIEACRVAQHYSWNASGYFHNPHPAPDNTPQPKPAQFVIDCVNDGAIPAGQRQNIAIAGLAFKTGEKPMALSIWNLIKAALSGNNAAITAIQGHATNNNITLP